MSQPETSVSDPPLERLNVVVCGSDAAVKASISDLLVGQREQRAESGSVCVRREAEVSGHLLTLVEMPALYNTQLSEEQVMQQTLQCVSLCPPGVHAFLFVVAEGRLTDEDKAEMERIQSIFSSRVLEHTIVLLSQDDVELHQSVRSVSESCKGGAYHPSSNTSVSKLLGRIEQLLVDNHRAVYTPLMYLEAQVEAQQRYKSEIAEMKAKISTLDAKMSRPDTITIVLLGKTGVGKSAAGNTIFGGRNVFREDLSYKPITTVCQKETAEVDERQITVIDTPALVDTEASHEEVRKEIRKSVSMATPGPHVFLLVLRVGQRFSGKEDLKMIQDIFGEQSVKYTMVLFTEGDRLGKTSIEQYLGEPGSDMMRLVEECGNRYHVFNNKERRDHSQVTDLLHKIYNMNRGSCYTNQMFQQVEIEKHEEQERILRMRVANLEREKQELKSQMKRMMPEERQKSELVRKRREEEFSNRVKEMSSEVYCLEKKKEFNEMKKCSYSVTLKKGEETTCTNDERTRLEELITRLNLNLQNKLTTADFHEITKFSLQDCEPSGEMKVVPLFMQKLLLMDYRARHCVLEATHAAGFKENENSAFLKLELKYGLDNEMPCCFEIHPMDVQMAVFHCSDSFLKQLIVTKLSQCQYALPLLVPDPFTREIEFPLWTFRQIKKSWKCTDQSGKITNKTVPICEAETPMVAFFRLGSISSSKSQLINSLINEKHHTFFHRNCPGSSRKRLLMDGVVEIAWYCPSGKNSDHFTDCVAFCNLHGDAGTKEEQYEILTNMATVNVVFLPDFGQKNYYKGLVRRLFRSSKPLICILTDNDSDMTEMSESKYIIGLKDQKSTSIGDKNQHHLSETLRKTIRKCWAGQSNTFRLGNVVNISTRIRVDEQNEDCQRGKSAALNIEKLLEETELTAFKEIHLPCQGKLWHEWCKKNKELHQPHGHNIEMYRSDKLQEMSRIREQQRAHNPSKLVEMFTDNLKSLESKENFYFLKWVEIVFSKIISNGLYKLHEEYEEQWTKVQQLKSNQTTEQMELEKISEQLNSASFGIEHFLREMGQKFESHDSTCSNENMQSTITSFPAIAAEVMMRGYPLELMDGDAAHVPLIWVSAVLDEVIKKLGNQRVFVLSVLGLQSSGKSTLLNAMFGLQFAVSAGRCTRGAFMQLVKVSEEMKNELKFDYILVVDTEGLRASELDGMSTRNHDNELAAFVVGLGNLTLINIMGENPAEMQDILQIVVQAFLRMKKVRLSPSCMFVHQNVGDITAGEKTMEGRRRLQMKLDEMTVLAANEEVCDAEHFSDVIAFDVKSDVRYFAHLWEGSPPMAPLSPSYIEHVQELKKSVISKAKHSDGLTFSQLKDRVKDLWTALLHENFVFSFKNTREIAVYRKLEEEYGKWTWKLRSAMLEIQDNLHTKINNKQIQKVDYQDLVDQMKETLQTVEELVKSYFDLKQDGRDILVEWREKFHKKVIDLYEDLLKQTQRELDDVIYQKEACKKVDEQKTQYEAKLFEKSKERALELRSNANNEEELEKHFSSVWGTWISDLTRNCPVIKPKDIKEDITRIISSAHEGENVSMRKGEEYNKINTAHDFNKYVNIKKKWWKKIYPVTPTLPPEEQQRIMDMTQNIIDKTEALAKSKPVAKMGYNESYIYEIAQLVKRLVVEHKSQFAKYEFKREFTVDLSLHVCELAAVRFAKMDKEFREATDPLVYLEKMKPQYYSVFQKFCQSATSAAAFGSVICSKLEESITNSVYIRTARDLAHEMITNIPAFNGNRSNMEKHILKSLAEEENFEKFMSYIFHPQKYFKNFIKDQVKCYLERDNPNTVAQIRGIIAHKQQRVITAAETATDEVMKNKGNVNMWLEKFSKYLKEELEINIEHLTVANCGDTSDVQLLKEVVEKEIDRVTEKLKAKITRLSDLNMKTFRKRPDEILIEHFCRCCWAKCPFCKAICTNTMKDHDGDHSAPFHRNCGINGWYYRGTQNLALNFCTSSVASDCYFYIPKDSYQGRKTEHIQEDDGDLRIPWKQYRLAGPPYADWNITPDLSELPYWKWFVCRFQTDLEERYSKTFQGCGRIPYEWKKYKKNHAKDSVDKYI